MIASGTVNLRFPSLLPAALICLAGGFGCAGPDPGRDASADGESTDRQPVVDRALEVGTGQSFWEPLPDGAAMELIHGPQGGYHLFARIRQQALGGDVQVTFRVTPVEGGEALNDPTDRVRLIENRGLIRTGAGWESSSALLVILTRIRGPSEVVGRRLVLEASVTPTGTAVPSTVRRTITVVDET